MFLNDVEIPVSGLVGPENEGWRVAQETLSAERGMTMLELAERLGRAGFIWLVEACNAPDRRGVRPIDDRVVQDRLAQLEIEVTALRSMYAGLVERNEQGSAKPADASVVKLFYSELLQRMTDFGAEVVGLEGQTVTHKPISSGWESGAWVLDFISSWEWTIPGGTSEIQRSIIGERGLGLPREPLAKP
jgi:alkylation response protein AidB-like acyl-CoA dehydrogenase